MGEPNTTSGEVPEGTEIPQPDAAPADQVENPADAALAGALAEASRMREEWLRAKAETENVRRRSAEDVSRAHKYGVETLSGALLGVKDSLEAALTVEATSVDSFKRGVELTARQLDAVFERFNIKPIAPAAGDKFDPHVHQAISSVPSEQEPNTVVALLQMGWQLHERVLRPALVTVAAAPGVPG